MAKIIQTFTVLRKVFLPDVLPWPYLLAESNLEKIRTRYKCGQLMQNLGPLGVPSQVASPTGEFTVGETTLLLEQLIIEPTVLQFQISGNSDQADEFAKDLGTILREIDPDKKYSEERELTKTYQTIAIVKLSFPYDALFSKTFSRYLNQSMIPRLKPKDAELEVRLSNLRWTVSYRANTTDFLYLPKLLVIEPRQGSRPDDMLYFTQSPTDFRTHMHLVEALEKTVK